MIVSSFPLGQRWPKCGVLKQTKYFFFFCLQEPQISAETAAYPNTQ